MNKFIISVAMILLLATNLSFAEQLAQDKQADWQNDFTVFIKYIQEVAEKSGAKHDGFAEVDDLNKIFLNKTVKWSGSLKYVHKDRPYFKDSFIKVSPDTSMACVMYYPAEDAKDLWGKIKSGSTVIYTGKITAVQIETSMPGKPFPYIDLNDVKPVVKEE